MIQRIGVFGTSESGKTTLAKALVTQFWAKHRIPAIVLDPNLEQWPASASVTDDKELYLSEIVKHPGSLIVIEEASSTIDRDRTMIPVFTRSRHAGNSLLIVGHYGSNLLPDMRDQLNTLFLFRQNKKAAQSWAELFADERIEACAELGQYEFLKCQRFQPPQRLRLKI